MASSNLFLLLFLLPLYCSSSNSATSGSRTRSVYIIRVDNDLKPAVFSDVESWYASTLTSLSTAAPTSSATLEDVGPLHVYQSVFHGFSAVLTDSEADDLRAFRGVLAVFPDRARRLHTTRSPQFLGLVSYDSRQPSNLVTSSGAGAGSVVAILDTGIRPTHRSFTDEGLPPAPPRWKGICQVGPSFPATSCNRKIIGARFFPSGFLAAAGRGNVSSSGDVLSPWDTEGHGTHTASTAAGLPVANASLFGYAAGVASGAAPYARIAAYKVCWSSGCFDSDILAAFDAAVEDGADVISLSVGAGPVPYHLDPIAIGAFAAAAERGVVVVASGGNDGPGEMTVTNVAPWIATVGAGTIDRRFPAEVVLGNGVALSGTSLYAGQRASPRQWFPLIYAGNASSTRPGVVHSTAPFCARGSLDHSAARGKVVLCQRGGVPRVEKGLAVKEAGGAGMVVANQFLDGEGVVPDAHLLPALSVGYTQGSFIHAYIRTAASPRVRLAFHGTRVGVRPAPVVASFSGRGPNAQSQHIIKPDLVAPGVGILAAWPDGTSPSGLRSDPRRTEFNVLSGTSMACPHVSGVVALLRAAHPDWSPAAVRSAMMTTAYVTDNLGQPLVDESSANRSTEWAHGSGHVDPDKAADPGLVYDLTAEDYLTFLCNSKYSELDIKTIARKSINCSRKVGKPWDLNYPSISVLLEQSSTGRVEAVVRRTLTSVAEGRSEYAVGFTEPSRVRMVIEPDKLVFDGKGDKKEFMVRVAAERVKLLAGDSRTEFGSITWTDGKHRVRSPIGFTWQQPFN
ncbi:subtilisin-like protease SBT1.5 [Typha latifolia]|uniref:subtilisin-like protease SBT1.5 n=1 Tax=Typha latifolia TaxID=4733 RepID=UPI003C2E1AF2